MKAYDREENNEIKGEYSEGVLMFYELGPRHQTFFEKFYSVIFDVIHKANRG